ncbi:hypothetical protein, partial [Streptomyces sp. NPDC052127]|uniref:hypothetical protein n=1 Tax=Streptomyces sp. NPDC052127 TaxID=3155679 RepID=UPI003433E8EC
MRETDVGAPGTPGSRPASGAGAGLAPPIALGAVGKLPAIWLVGGLAVLLYGTAPRLAPAAWGVAGA